MPYGKAALMGHWRSGDWNPGERLELRRRDGQLHPIEDAEIMPAVNEASETAWPLAAATSPAWTHQRLFWTGPGPTLPPVRSVGRGDRRGCRIASSAPIAHLTHALNVSGRYIATMSKLTQMARLLSLFTVEAVFRPLCLRPAPVIMLMCSACYCSRAYAGQICGLLDGCDCG